MRRPLVAVLLEFLNYVLIGFAVLEHSVDKFAEVFGHASDVADAAVRAF